VEHGSGSEGRRRGGGQHMKCADRQMEELTEDKQTPCSHLVRHLRQAQNPYGTARADVSLRAVLSTVIVLLRLRIPKTPIC
jgi:hypothetical protein